jgi:putative transposase
MCRVLGVSTSGYYAWRNRSPSRRVQGNAALLEQILIIHAWSRRTFGDPGSTRSSWRRASKSGTTESLA